MSDRYLSVLEAIDELDSRPDENDEIPETLAP
jgi:hypothetical protein